MINIVIPMAGRGSRFKTHGYALPKPLIKIHGKPMIQIVIENLSSSLEHRFIFLCLREHLLSFNLEQKLNQWSPGCAVLPIHNVTEGAACTVLLAREFIDNDTPLMIANSDQWINFPIDDYLKKIASSDNLKQDGLDGLIMTMTAHDPKWSFIRANDQQEVIEVIEKTVISNQATVGIYNYRRGTDFVSAAQKMIKANLRVNNEFYVAPTYNQMIADGKKISFMNIGKDTDKMFGLGTPEDLNYFLQLPVSKKAAGC